VPVVPRAEWVAAVAATDAGGAVSRIARLLGILGATLLALPASGGVLPEDRADIMYHRYDGGGVTIDGPSLLVRKKFAEKYSVSASYYMDMVSSASIDVVTTASPYKETRKQFGTGLAYLRGKVTYSADFTNSRENDYESNTASLSVSQDMFGDLTTIGLGFSRGWDRVRQRGAPEFAATVDRRVYSLDVSQIVTKNLIAGAAWETVTEEGFLNNPYRQIRYLDSTVTRGYSFEPERYPRTRTSNAASFRARYYLPYRAAIGGDYRFYTDTWGIDAHTVEVNYTHPWRGRWVFDARVRYYRQNEADFFQDLFPRSNFSNFIGRDKELASFSSQGVGFGVSYEYTPARLRFLQRSTINLRYDWLHFKYNNFRDLRVQDVAAGTEPLYKFNASVIQVFVSGWF
jgi:Protein of unknown function (DUF3570)